ncbi:hypothetical protein J7K55_04460 [Candidatus Aerophobetes bacterium]|nr:hypothetical protein [Candidatus Aerophobetes bacterium]
MFKRKKGIWFLIVAIFFLCVMGGAALAQDFNFRVLLVGYGWYTGIPEGQVNVAQRVVQDLHGSMIAGTRVHSIVIPVTWKGAVPPVIASIKEYDPDIVIALGASPGTYGLRPEKYGCNTSYGNDASVPTPVMRGKMADGKRVYEPINPNGPAFEECTIPVDKIVNSILKAGIPAYAGSKFQKEGYGDTWFSTAGTYLCNWATYSISQYIREHGLDIKFGFIHIPTLPEYVAGDMLEGKKGKANMPLELIEKAIKIAIKTAVEDQTGGRVWY